MSNHRAETATELAFAGLLPPFVHVRSVQGDLPGAVAWPAEVAALRDAVPLRQREFVTGRVCARRALAELGIAPCAIPVGPRRAPVWPAGVVGSMTHGGGLRAAAVARDHDLTSVGIDVEPDGPLPQGVLTRIASRDEAVQVSGPLRRVGVHADRLLFSAKEAVFKAVDAQVVERRSLRQLRIRLGSDGSFRAEVDPTAGEPFRRGIEGRWTAVHGLLLTAVSIPRPDGGSTCNRR